MFGGVSGLYSRALAGIKDLRTSINDASSSEHLVNVAKAQLASAEERLQDAEASVTVFRGKAEALQSEIETSQHNAAAAQAKLARLRPYLNSDHATFAVGGFTYSRAEVEDEARGLLTAFEENSERAKAEAAQQEEFKKAIAQSQSDLAGSRQQFEAARTKLAQLELHLTTEQQKAEVASAASSLRGSTAVELGSGFSESMDALEKRLAKLKISNTSRPNSHPGGVIVWDESEPSIPARIDRALGAQPANTSRGASAPLADGESVALRSCGSR